MKKSYLIYVLWLALVILWNFLYPEASPIYDVIMAILLSAMTYLLKKINLF